MRTLAIRIVQAVIVVAALAIVIGKGVALQEVRAQDAVIAAPSTWVPFTATMTRTEALDAPVVGRFYRGADGSNRLETGPSLQDIRVIDIKNMARERTFRYFGDKGWFENPMKLREPLMPPIYKQKTLAAAVHVTYETLSALQTVSSDGRIEIMVPALNFFIVDRVLPEGSRIRYHDIQVDVPVDETLFVPPPGVAVTYRDTPAGIVEHGPEDTHIDPKTGKVTFDN